MKAVIFILITSLGFSRTKDVWIKSEKCKYCQFLVDTFEEGLRNTARSHFGGGDTAWEEKNLGKYATSETRMVEAMEGICKKTTLSDTMRYDTLNQLEFKCSVLHEEHEELLEEYFYKHQQANMTNWLCVNKLQVCCPDGHYGKDCAACPGVDQGVSACFGRGKCHGDGSREGSGKCKCDTGYQGNLCRHCETDYFEVEKTDATITCEKCFEGCAGGCSSSGATGCSKCKPGWELSDSEGCKDVDECSLTTPPCTGANSKCVNTEGSYKCECQDGYKMEAGVCVLDIEAAAAPLSPPPIEGEDGESEDEETNKISDEL